MATNELAALKASFSRAKDSLVVGWGLFYLITQLYNKTK
jgi:hypothetical protein